MSNRNRRFSAWLSLGVCGALALVPTLFARAAEITAKAASNPYPLATEGPKPAPVTPPTDKELRTAIARGVDYLLGSQRSNGAWGGPQRGKGLNLYAPIPGAHHAFRTGATALVIEALMASHNLFPAEKQKKIDAALDRAQDWLLANAGNLRRSEQTALYNVWGHAYAIQAIVLLHARAAGNADLQEKLIELLRYQVDHLQRYQFVGGGWGYYDDPPYLETPGTSTNCFVTATALIALKQAESLGVKFPEASQKKAIESIKRQRYPDFSYAYGEYLKMYPRMDINRPAGSLGRSQVCNLALRLYGDKLVTDEIIETWLDRLFARNGWLSIGRKIPVPHDSYFSIAGYFYYYGHYYAALCIDELPQRERPERQDQLARILLPLQEKDGSWWDWPMYDYHQAWGTGMAVSTLVRCRHSAEQAAVSAEVRKD